MCIILIDTSVFVEIINIPNMNDHHKFFKKQMREYIERRCEFLLPLATIVEAGNHIAQNGNGAQRRKCAEIFIQQVKASFTGDAPWKVIQTSIIQDIENWIDKFPDMVMRNKSYDKNEGISLGDMMIIQEWKKICAQNPMRTVMIWSKDADMQSYCREI